jgi:serine/threonine-protein phosphatase 2A regulatory subunit A
MSILEYAPSLAQSIDSQIFTSELLPAILRWLCDPVFKVREAASEIIAKVATEIGDEATDEFIVTEIVELSRNSNYLYRITALMAIVHMPPQFQNQLLPLAIELASDPVPNVRYNAAKSLGKFFAQTPKDSSGAKIIATITTLSKDTDNDVKFFAQNVIDSI